MGDAFVPGQLDATGSKYKWMNPIAVAEIAIICIYFILPFTPAAVPGNDGLRVEVRQLRADPHASARS